MVKPASAPTTNKLFIDRRVDNREFGAYKELVSMTVCGLLL